MMNSTCRPATSHFFLVKLCYAPPGSWLQCCAHVSQNEDEAPGAGLALGKQEGGLGLDEFDDTAPLPRWGRNHRRLLGGAQPGKKFGIISCWVCWCKVPCSAVLSDAAMVPSMASSIVWNASSGERAVRALVMKFRAASNAARSPGPSSILGYTEGS